MMSVSCVPPKGRCVPADLFWGGDRIVWSGVGEYRVHCHRSDGLYLVFDVSGFEFNPMDLPSGSWEIFVVKDGCCTWSNKVSVSVYGDFQI